MYDSLKPIHRVLSVALLGLVLVLPLATSPRAAAQSDPGELQVWFFPQTDNQPPLVEYRDAGGNIQVSYALATDSVVAPRQAAGLVVGWDLQSIPIFDPVNGTLTHRVPPALPSDSDATFYNLSEAVPGPTGEYAYSITQQDMEMQTAAFNQVYVATPGDTHQLIYEQDSPDAWTALQPFGWARDGATLLVHDMPQGIGGYILFWTWQNVQALDLDTRDVRPLGNLDGYSADLNYTAALTTGGSGPAGITVTDVLTGQATPYALPPLPEHVQTGGGARFSPGNTYVAYQVARNDPEREKFYTIVTTLATGESRVVLEDEATASNLNYGFIAGWLDDTTLIVGGPWNSTSAIIDATNGALLREELGTFLGYADGIRNTSGFAPAGTVYTVCPGAPPSRLAAGMRGRITITSGAMTNVRYWAGLNADIAGQMPEGASFTVRLGPTCADGYAWWNLGFDSGLEGYVAEGTPDEYWLEPLE